MQRLASNQSGTSTVELAIVLPALALLTFMAADVAMAFKAKIGLQRAAERTAQMATAAGINGAAYGTDNLKADAAAAAGVATGNVNITKTLLCNGVQSASDPCPDGQQISRYVAIGITGTYMPMFAKLAPGTRWSAQGIALSGSASVRMQ
ncbi:TadE/TadG family type IV pilus assembly protein [Sphingobium estronivorans]|uniref:TadE/TadG family type IV pilus assembly protein n=1 Tax=Sphingobium estronivorans TaxID=1577690 RepID=UPI00123B32DF|nr:TadE/TadG family type IV pilus assembly protein [Sphingobium estronivorans]